MTDSPAGNDGSGARSDGREPEISYDVGESERPSEAVVRAVAALTGRRPIDIEPLYDVVDPDHLDGLFDEPGAGGGVEGRSVTFSFGGCHVSVTREEVRVRADDRTGG